MSWCIHEIELANCATCTPPPTADTGASADIQDGPFVWLSPARIYHLPTCPEVTWDSADTKSPAPRINLTPLQVWELRDELDRGCYKCGANAGLPPER